MRLPYEPPLLSVGILSANLLKLGEELEEVVAGGARLVHVDVMDGRFCPSLTVGPAFVKALEGPFVKDVHLMIEEPLRSLDAYVEAGAGIVTFHVESARHPHRVLQELEGRAVRGIALNPGTPVAAIEPLLDDLELVLLLAVNPGWSGQQFAPATGERLRQARELIGEREVLVGVDGGITRASIADVSRLGADVVVAGSAVFQAGATAESVRHFADALAGASPPS